MFLQSMVRVFSDSDLKDSVTFIIQLLGLYKGEVERLYLLNKYQVLRTSALSVFNPTGIFDITLNMSIRILILRIFQDQLLTYDQQRT